MKKYLVVAVILLFISVSVIPSTGKFMEQASNLSSDGNTLYVGGDGPGNYTKIQDAINDAINGDTVFVYNGTYYEHIVINVSISLIGEDKETTIIDGDFKGHCVVIKADGVVVKRFTIKNAYWGPGGDRYTGMVIESSNNKISENILHHHYYLSIVMYKSNNEIFSNYIYASNNCIASFRAENNSIYNNTINTGDTAISIRDSKDCKVHNNTIERAINYGIYVHDCINIEVKNNFITNTKIGLKIFISEFIYVSKNNIIDNKIGVDNRFSYSIFISFNNFISNSKFGKHRDSDTRWINNYYGRPRVLPKIIFGYFVIELGGYPFRTEIAIPRIRIDMHPALIPYDIEV